MKGLKIQTPWLTAVFALVLIVSMSSAFGASPAEPIMLKASVWTPANHPFSRAGVWILQEAEKRSEGKIKIEYYWSGSLLPAKETVAGMKTGVADISFINPGYEPGKIPLCTVGTLPAIADDWWPTVNAFAELHQMPELKAELDAYNMMYLGPLGTVSYGIWMRRPARSIADLKGKKLVSVGEHNPLLKALGAVPVSIVSTEAYQALEKGIADGALANPAYAIGYKWPEVAPNYFSLTVGNKAHFVAINKNSWNKIPADIQKIFVGLRNEAFRKGHEIYQGYDEDEMKKLVDKGVVKVTKPSAEDRAQLEATAQNVSWITWVKKMEEKGLAGKKVCDKWRELYKKYDAQSPFKK